MSGKESFWIGAKAGLLDQKHIEAMGPAVWMFLYLLRGQTGLNPAGEGIYHYGHPITLGKISEELKGTPLRTIRKWIARLKARGYIRAEDHGHAGSIFWVAKGKDKRRRNPKETQPVLPQRPKRDDEVVSHGPEKDVRAIPQRPNFGAEQDGNFQQPTQPNGVPSIPQSSTPISLSYYNKEKRAGKTINHQSDDATFRTLPLIEQAKQRLVKSKPQEEGPYIECGLEVIEERVHDLGCAPAIAKYYITAYENLKASEKDWNQVEWCVQNPSSNDHRKKLNALILRAEEESKRTGKPVIDVFHALRHCEQLYATKNGQPLSEFVGACMDGWEALVGGRQPRAFVQVANRIREQERPKTQEPMRELVAEPWGARARVKQ